MARVTGGSWKVRKRLPEWRHLPLAFPLVVLATSCSEPGLDLVLIEAEPRGVNVGFAPGPMGAH